jgi:hypothetical protein
VHEIKVFYEEKKSFLTKTGLFSDILIPFPEKNTLKVN